MTEDEREQQVRRTRSVRRGVIAAGATGALGAAIAIGTTIHTSGSADPGVTEDNQNFDQTQQPPQANQLAGPSGGGPAQGHSAGS